MTIHCNGLLVRQPIANHTLRVLASRDKQPKAVQFDKQNRSSVAKSLKTISVALQDDPLTRYLACNSDDERARDVVTEYAQEILMSASSAGLLFHVNDFAAAALAHRIPEELVIPPDLPSAGDLPNDRAEKLGVTFNKFKAQFLQDHGPFIYISMMGVRPDMQRQGLGGLLLATICNVADSEGKWCYLEATQAGFGLYQKHGFVVVCTSQLGPEAPVMQHMGRPPQ